jgi:hypothetical protein
MTTFLSPCRFNAWFNGLTDFIVKSAVAGFNTPENLNVTDQKVYRFYAENADGTVFERGSGLYDIATHTLIRQTVIENSDGTFVKIDFETPPQVTVFPSKSSTLETNQVLRGYLSGLTLSTGGSSASFGVSVGMAADSTNASMMMLVLAYTKTTDGFSAGNGNGALDTGAIAALTWYHVFLIKNLGTGLVDILVSLSVTAPTLPTGYTLFRRIGSMATNGSSQWTSFIQTGDEFVWSVPFTDINVVNPGTAAVLRTLSVPSGIKVEAVYEASPGSQSGVANGTTYFSDPDTTDSDPNTISGCAIGVFNNNAVSATSRMSTRTNTSHQIRSRAVQSGASSVLIICTRGWIDTRGRFA